MGINTDVLNYLDVDPLADYWYCDGKTLQWIVYKKNGESYSKPVRYQDLSDKGKEEHPELKNA